MLLAGLGPAASSPVSELTATGRYSTALRGAPRQFARPHASLHMANIASQKKRILRSERERLENRQYTSAIKTYFRRLEGLAKESDSEATKAEHRRLVSTIDKAVKRGALHRNTGARKKSRAARTVANSGS
jgi:small subunit ribosomal protein S20